MCNFFSRYSLEVLILVSLISVFISSIISHNDIETQRIIDISKILLSNIMEWNPHGIFG